MSGRGTLISGIGPVISRIGAVLYGIGPAMSRTGPLMSKIGPKKHVTFGKGGRGFCDLHREWLTDWNFDGPMARTRMNSHNDREWQ